MIGLRRGDVRLFEHNKEWKIEGERTVNELRKILGSDAVDIQHVGSTSIKSIKAKPIMILQSAQTISIAFYLMKPNC